MLGLPTGIDTDKHKYPIGSGRVTFSNQKSFMKAVAAAFVEIKALKFTKKVTVSCRTAAAVVWDNEIDSV